jgi:hypothetical protein
VKSYTLHRAGGGLLATHVALVHAGVAARPLLAIDTGSRYTIVEPKFIAALGLDITQPKEFVPITGIGGNLRVPSFVIERVHCFGCALAEVRVLALDFSRLLPTINGVLGLAELRAAQATVDLTRNVVTTP